MQPHSFQAPHQPALKPRWQWPWATQPCSHNAAEGDSRALFSQLCFLSGPILSGVFYSSPEAKNVFVENNAGDRKVPPDAACHASTPQLTTRAGIPPPSSMFKLPFLLRTPCRVWDSDHNQPRPPRQPYKVTVTQVEAPFTARPDSVISRKEYRGNQYL